MLHDEFTIEILQEDLVITSAQSNCEVSLDRYNDLFDQIVNIEKVGHKSVQSCLQNSGLVTLCI